MFLGLYIAAVVLIIVYFIVLLKSCKDLEFSRGDLMFYALVTFCPFINVGIASVCGLLMVALFYEKLEIQKWMDKPFINARKE